MTPSNEKHTIGIDVAKHRLDICILPQHQLVSFTNDTQGIQELLTWLGTLTPISLIVMEATGGYEKPLAYALSQAGHPISIINPRQARAASRVQCTQTSIDRFDHTRKKSVG